MNDSIVVKSRSDENKSSANRLKRRSLQSIQPISTNNKVLTRSMANTKQSNSDKEAKQKKSEQKNQRITKWLTQKDSIDSDLKYWKTLAKEREKALAIALKENQELTEDNHRLNQKNEQLIHEMELLKQENQHLSQLAEEGIKLRDLIHESIEGIAD